MTSPQHRQRLCGGGTAARPTAHTVVEDESNVSVMGEEDPGAALDTLDTPTPQDSGLAWPAQSSPWR
jgi:uncharacterized protein (DUF1778 family)